MKLKPLIITVALLAALAYFLLPGGDTSSTRSTSDALAGQALIPTEDLAKLGSLEFFDGGSSPAVLLRKSTGHWRVPAQHDLPANFATLARLVQELSETKILRTVTRNPERLAELDLGEKRIVLKDAQNTTLLDLSLGTSHSSGGLYAQLAGSDAAILLDRNLWFQTTPDSWVDKQLFAGWKNEDIAGLELPFQAPMRSLSLTRPDPSSPFTANSLGEHESINNSATQNLLRTLLNARWTTVTSDLDSEEVAEAAAQAQPLVLKHFDGSRLSLRIGRQPARPLPLEENHTTGEETATSDQTEASTDLATKGNESTPQMSQPGPVYAFLKPEALDHPLSGIAEHLAFAIPANLHDTLPRSPDSLISFSEPTPSPTPAP